MQRASGSSCVLFCRPNQESADLVIYTNVMGTCLVSMVPLACLVYSSLVTVNRGFHMYHYYKTSFNK